jgi:hypothetical protein
MARPRIIIPLTRDDKSKMENSKDMPVAKSHTGPQNQLESISEVGYYSSPPFKLDGGNPQRKRERAIIKPKFIEIESKSKKGIGFSKLQQN